MITLYRPHPSPLADDIQATLQDLVLAHEIESDVHIIDPDHPGVCALPL